MIEGSLPDEWFCNTCQNKPGSRDPIPGTFGPLLLALDEKNPSQNPSVSISSMSRRAPMESTRNLAPQSQSKLKSPLVSDDVMLTAS